MSTRLSCVVRRPRLPSGFGNLPLGGPSRILARGVCDRKYMKKKGVDTKSLPFLVERTKSGNLPVYVKDTLGGMKFTLVRGIFGDVEHIAEEVRQLCTDKVRVAKGGRKTVRVLGDHGEKLKAWLH